MSQTHTHTRIKPANHLCVCVWACARVCVHIWNYVCIKRSKFICIFYAHVAAALHLYSSTYHTHTHREFTCYIYICHLAQWVKNKSTKEERPKPKWSPAKWNAHRSSSASSLASCSSGESRRTSIAMAIGQVSYDTLNKMIIKWIHIWKYLLNLLLLFIV